MRRLTVPLAVALLLLLAACGGSSGPAPSYTPIPTPIVPTPTPRATSGPDTLQISVVGAAVAVYLITTVPVAVVRNQASRHAATQVDVRFAVLDAAGQPVGGTDAYIPYLAPGQTMGIAGRIDRGGSDEHATATVISEKWSPAGPTPPLSFGPATYACGSCGSGPGYGTATATLSAVKGTNVSAGITVTAVCYYGGVINGGYSITREVTSLPLSVQVPVIVNQPPGHCVMYASPGTAGP